MQPQTYLRKYFIMGSQNCTRDPEVILQEAIAGGITAFQYREKGRGSLQGEAKIALGKRLRQICREAQIPFFINDDVELIEVFDVDGIHVGQEDLSPLELRNMYPHLQIGLSVTNEAELRQSPLAAVDYVGAGPIFPTTTKEDAKQAVGLTWIRTLRKQFPELPIVAIGGIRPDNVQDVLAAGANGVAFISVVTNATNVEQVVKSL